MPNPNLSQYYFEKKYDWREPCNQTVSLRVPMYLKDAMKNGEIRGWQECARRAIDSYYLQQKQEAKKN